MANWNRHFQMETNYESPASVVAAVRLERFSMHFTRTDVWPRAYVTCYRCFAQKQKWWSRKESDAHKDIANSSDEELYLASTKPDDMADLTAGPVDKSVWHETKQRYVQDKRLESEVMDDLV